MKKTTACSWPHRCFLIFTRSWASATRSRRRKPGSRSPYSALACDAFAVIQREGALSKQKLLEKLGGGVSTPALDKALAELWSKLRITRVDYKASEGSVWDLLYRWAPRR